MIERETLTAADRRILRAVAGERVIVDGLWIANTSASPRTWRLHLLRAPISEACAAGNAIFYDVALAANSTEVVETNGRSLVLEPGEALFARASAADVVAVTLFVRRENA